MNSVYSTKIKDVNLATGLKVRAIDLKQLNIRSGLKITRANAFSMIEQNTVYSAIELHQQTRGSFGIVIMTGENFAQLVCRDNKDNYVLCIVEKGG